MAEIESLNTKNLDIETKHLAIVKNILQQYPYSFYVFGSRVTGKARKLSDLDVCFFDRIPISHQSQLEEDFVESDLPYKVDLVDWQACDPEFQKIIIKNIVRIQ